MTIVHEPIVIALGSNMQDPPAQIRAAFERLQRLPDSRNWRLSRVFRTPPWGIREQAEFANAVALADVSLAPVALMQALLKIEAELGRERLGPRNGPRSIDLDLIGFGHRQFEVEALVVPHPRARERAFVLGPWRDLAPDASFPDGTPIAGAWAALPVAERNAIQPWN
ncbi:2-amino-4-hydroxy-6-hydroxymethyldihydropteridine diphosphokinase [Ahniella affigens]|uniref:2-amino-4-hydroxy-6-hydroxymethyldihydropteridine pyrophosphokinase n=1 Tax=Ahniella affigens TaxID=2021234 RepID=A0A2P1PPX3_9GAMM|nr:2-amino-4-hydroxy-6-hydroxymethyldihydropteridine diphosphokinase [Ahniella affigens]AVP96872.1 2-amino-4-hydroxy-6-hydroxymethyldihydropteridine diphosphokinase [Ahniella affigens]